MDLLVHRLLEQAQLFDDPASYEAGVRDALDLLWGGVSDDLPRDAARTGRDRGPIAV